MSLASSGGAERSALLMSIKPRFANAILDGEKTVELRRKAPTQTPPTVVIYGSGSERRILGTAQLDGVHTAPPDEIWSRFGERAGVTRADFDLYFVGCELASALELSDPNRVRAEIDLDGLREMGIRPPQSWRYLSDDLLEALLNALNTDQASVQNAEDPLEREEMQERSAVAPRALRRLTDPLAAAAALAVPCVVSRLPSRVRYGMRCWSMSSAASVLGEVADLPVARWKRRSVPGAELI
jgi:predicted transcriptional regulator